MGNELGRLKVENTELKRKLEERRDREEVILPHTHSYRTQAINSPSRFECNQEYNDEEFRAPVPTDSRDVEVTCIRLLARCGIPLINVRRTLMEIIQHITADSSSFLNCPEWRKRKAIPGMFERIYGVKPFSPCSFDAAGWHCYGEEGKEIPHKKVVIGHMGDQELSIDVLDCEDQ